MACKRINSGIHAALCGFRGGRCFFDYVVLNSDDSYTVWSEVEEGGMCAEGFGRGWEWLVRKC